MDETGAQVEVWKKVVDVQQHFNDLELRIRNFALVVTGAFLGLGGYALKDGGFAGLGAHQISTASLIISAALLPLSAFYLMDRLWYHRLLDGAVKAGISAEGKLNALGVHVDLGTQISKASPVRVPFFGNAHSRHKMDGFYGLLAVAIIALSLAIAFGVKPAGSGPDARQFVSVARDRQLADDDAARAICKAEAADIFARSAGGTGSFVVDPKTGQQAVLVAGRWRLVPNC